MTSRESRLLEDGSTIEGNDVDFAIKVNGVEEALVGCQCDAAALVPCYGTHYHTSVAPT